MNNTAIKLNQNKENILQYNKTKLNDWIKNDSRSIQDKAIIMFIDGKKHMTICKYLKITSDYFRRIVFDYYKKFEILEKPIQKKATNIPINFSTWNSNILYSHLHKIRNR
ncbi:MAG: hypothetical protein ABF289_16845 [Clostridiales bacterium]